MKFNTTIPSGLKPFYELELNAYRTEFMKGDFDMAWNHLERAHIIGQQYPYEHSYVHWKMLQFGFKMKSRKEIIGQIPRLLVGGVKSFVGRIPIGNPGGANVPPLKTFPIDEELQEVFIKVGVQISSINIYSND